MTTAVRLRVTLADLDPAPWREIEAPLSMTFRKLHQAIQAAFLWHDAHLWAFDLGDRRFGPFTDEGFDGTPTLDAAKARLTLLSDRGVQGFDYTYDFGDDWLHEIEVLALFEAPSGARLPRFVDGRWRAPPEDIGGPPGFEAFLEALADPAHPEHADLLDWHGGPFDPDDIGPETVAAQFSRLGGPRLRDR